MAFFITDPGTEGINKINGIKNDFIFILHLSSFIFQISEDIVVTESERGKGISKELFKNIIRKATDSDCTGMMWQVLNWNAPAINFYKKHVGAHLDDEWVNCHLMGMKEMESAPNKLAG